MNIKLQLKKLNDHSMVMKVREIIKSLPKIVSCYQLKDTRYYLLAIGLELMVHSVPGPLMLGPLENLRKETGLMYNT